MEKDTMKKILAKLIKKYVRVFPHYGKAVICPLAGRCDRACKCSEMASKAFMFDFKMN